LIFLRPVLCACLLLHLGCFTVEVGEPSEQRAVTIGFIPSTQAAWYADRNIQGRRPLTGGKKFADTLGMTGWAILTNLVFIGIPTLLNWATEPFNDWEPPRWGYGLPSRFCKESLIGYCKTSKLPPLRPEAAIVPAQRTPEGF
jgi:hypothetical protein